MANINLYELYNNKRRKYGVNDSSRYQGAFVEAVNHAFSTFNSEVYQADTLEYIRDFNDIISQRLASFSSLTFTGDADLLTAMSGRKYWAIEYYLERKHTTNGLTDTIDDLASNVVITILNDSLNIAGDAVSLDYTLPSSNSFRLLISSNENGITVLADDTTAAYTTDEEIFLGDVPDIDWVPDIEIIPALGTPDTPQPIDTVSSRQISGVSG